MPINSFLYPGASGPVVYEVDNSCRFNEPDDPSMLKTSASGNQRTFTVSVWLKRAKISSFMAFYSQVTDDNNYFMMNFQSSDKLDIHDLSSGAEQINFRTTAVFRDISAWYHIVCAVDTTQSTQSDRFKLWVNGTQITAFDNNTYPDQNDDIAINVSGEKTRVGAGYDTANYHFDGYMAEVVSIDGTAYDETNFGEFDEDSPNIWKPINVSGLSFGANGFYLDFEDSSNLGNDKNGGTDLTETNIAAIDQSTDTCTNNFCTLNPLVNVPYSTYSEGNTFVDVTSTGNSSHHTNYGTIAFDSGKWYWEAKALGGSKYTIGLSDANNQSNHQQVAGTNLIVGNQANSYVSGDAIGWYSTTLYKNGSTIASSLSEIVTNDIMMVAVDADNGKIYFGKNGTWRVANSTTFDSAQHDTTFTTGKFYVSAFSNEDCDWSVNWGSPSYSVSSGNADANSHGNFEYAVPSGYFALCTKNLAEFG